MSLFDGSAQPQWLDPTKRSVLLDQEGLDWASRTMENAAMLQHINQVKQQTKDLKAFQQALQEHAQQSGQTTETASMQPQEHVGEAPTWLSDTVQNIYLGKQAAATFTTGSGRVIRYTGQGDPLNDKDPANWEYVR